MVKNTKGGKGAKSMARKSVNVTNTQIRYSQDPLEVYGCVTKIFGNGMCEVTTNDNSTYMGHIRSKFRGRQKRHNMILVSSIVLVGMREWENPYKNCDIIFVYDDHHIQQLKTIPNIDIKNLFTLQNPLENIRKSKTEEEDIIDFQEEIPDIQENEIEEYNDGSFIVDDDGTTINIDDI
jgi:initiation factor 1A